MSRYILKDGKLYTRGGWPVCHQVYDQAMGEVQDGIFYRVNGYGGPAGERRPLVHIAATFPAHRRGRPRKADSTRDYGYGVSPRAEHRFNSYGLSADGRWWCVRHTPGRADAKARSLARPPYNFMGRDPRGMRRTYGDSAYLLAKAQLALQAAEVQLIAQQAAHPLI